MSTEVATSTKAVENPLVQKLPPAVAVTMARDPEAEKSVGQAIKLLARSLGRQAASRHIARGWSVMELGLALAVAALALAAALYFHSHMGRLP